jgi:hypothetical protein
MANIPLLVSRFSDNDTWQVLFSLCNSELYMANEKKNEVR